MSNLIHFDLLNLIVVVVGLIGAYFTLVRDMRWHTEWIKKHDAECDEQRKNINAVFSELKTSNSHLSTLVDSHHDRIVRIENQIDRGRE